MDKKAKSSSSSKRKERTKSPKVDDSKKKRKKHQSSSAEKGKGKEATKSTQRKSRWQAANTETTDNSKTVPIPVADIKTEKSLLPPKTYPNMRDLLPNKETLVDVLFDLVKDDSLAKITPDYLKKYSKEELKKLCQEELRKLSDDVILQIAYPQEKLSNKDEDEKLEKEKNLCMKPDQIRTSKEKEKENKDCQSLERKLEAPSPAETSDSLSSDVVELHTTPTDFATIGESNQIPVVIKEVAKDLILPERDAELLELEMRARAIRSLLKAKNQITNEEDATKDEQ